MMKVRRGHKEDLPEIIALAREFWEEAGYEDAGVKYNPAAILDLVSSMMDGAGVLAVAEEDDHKLSGFGLGAVVPLVFSPRVTTISVLSLYARDKKAREALNKKIKQVGAQLGAKIACSADLKLVAL